MLFSALPSEKFLPEKLFLTKVKDKPNVSRMWLSSLHSVHSRLKSGLVGGEAKVQYGIERDSQRKNPSSALTISQLVPAVGAQPASGLISLLTNAGMRTLIAVDDDSSMNFDMRALCYVCGFVAASTGAGIEPNLGTEKARATPVSPTRAVHLGNEPMFASELYRTREEFATLLHLAFLSGAKNISVTEQTVYASGGHLTGQSLGVYAAKIFANIMAVATTITAAASHYEAFFGGCLSSLRVLGHSWEGGACRDLFVRRSFPPIVGVLTPSITTVVGLSTINLLPRGDLLKYVVATLLECCGRVSRSDPTRNAPNPSVYVSDGSGKPSSLSGYEHDVYQMLMNWRQLAVKELALVASTCVDTSSLRDYFEADKVDEHLKPGRVAPFFYVEPGPVSTSTEGSIFSLGAQGKAVDLPMLGATKAYKTMAYQEHGGVPFPGSVVKYYIPGGYSARSTGVNLLLSGRYSRKNGLSMMRLSKTPQLGVVSSDLAMSDNDATNLADARWHTHHNPTPHPAENRTSMPIVVDYTYASGVHGVTIDDMLNAKVSSMFGPLTFVAPDTPKPSVYHRDVPQGLEEFVSLSGGLISYLEDRAGIIDLSSMLVSSPEVVETVTPPAVDIPVSEPAPPAVNETTESDDPVLTSPTSDQPTPVNPDAARLAPRVEQVSGAGS